MESVRCTTGNRACWYCSKKRRRHCDQVFQENYYRPDRPPEVKLIIQKRLVWSY